MKSLTAKNGWTIRWVGHTTTTEIFNQSPVPHEIILDHEPSFDELVKLAVDYDVRSPKVITVSHITFYEVAE